MPVAPDTANHRDWLQRLATGTRLFALVLACFAARAMFELRAAATWVNVEPDKQLEVPDSRADYTPPELHDYFAKIGPNGRRLYSGTQLTLDLFFPLCYGAMFIGMVARLVPGRSRWYWWIWLPLAVVFADIAENVMLRNLALKYVNEMTADWSASAETAASLTVLKWRLIGACGVLGATALICRVVVSIRRFVAWCR